jgi:hypothetical protein
MTNEEADALCARFNALEYLYLNDVLNRLRNESEPFDLIEQAKAPILKALNSIAIPANERDAGIHFATIRATEIFFARLEKALRSHGAATPQ